MHVSLSKTHEDFIKAQIESGEYSSSSDFIRDLIRHYQERVERKHDVIRAALIKGEQSGISVKSKEELRLQIKEELRLDGLL